jgi:hypothetical protein
LLGVARLALYRPAGAGGLLHRSHVLEVVHLVRGAMTFLDGNGNRNSHNAKPSSHRNLLFKLWNIFRF